MRTPPGMHPATLPGVPSQSPLRTRDLLRGIAIALSTQASTLCLFGVGFLTFHADPLNRVFLAVAITLLPDFLVALFLLVTAIVIRHDRPALGKGLAIGWAIGVVAMTAFTVLVFAHTSDWSGDCPCEPPIDFGQPW